MTEPSPEGTVCDGCQRLKFVEMQNLDSPHSTSWKCDHYGIVLGSDKNAKQWPFPDHCAWKVNQ